ncbi:MAG: aminoacetone oxidase family FAD-binding enzyme [Anaerolineaceae bacterium]
MQIGIIGGGPAGMMAAILVRQPGIEIQIFDANAEYGCKLSTTGAGRCNISNRSANADAYFTDDSAVLKTCFELIPNSEVLRTLEIIGIPTTSSEDSWIYPLSFSAANVVSILENNLEDIPIFRNTLITDIQKTNKGYILSTTDRTKKYSVDKVILACGGPANPQLGAHGDLYQSLDKLGHPILPVRPALTPIETDPVPFHKLQGVRLDTEIRLLREKKVIAHTIGNMIITQWGLNGPGVMNISHLIDPKDAELYSLKINFAPHFLDAMRDSFINPALQDLSPSSILKGFFTVKIVDFLLRQTNLVHIETCKELSVKQRESLFKAIQDQEISVRGVRGFKYAQASTGGIALADIDPCSMESHICKGLFFAGEILNVLGPCGGFNLHWAFLSGMLAAQGITKSK